MISNNFRFGSGYYLPGDFSGILRTASGMAITRSGISSKTLRGRFGASSGRLRELPSKDKDGNQALIFNRDVWVKVKGQD